MPPRPDPLERDIEAKCRKIARAAGGRLDKWRSPSQRSVMDRILTLPPPPGRKLGTVVFVELKRLGRKPSKQQAHRIEEFRDMGLRVEVIDSVEAFEKLVAECLAG